MKYGRMNWKRMNSWTMDDAKVRWRRERLGWRVVPEPFEVLTCTWRGSTMCAGRELRMLNCSSMVRSCGSPRSR